MRVFIAGPRAISKLNHEIEDRLYNIYDKEITVVVGDANGIDKAIQKYFFNLKYDNVYVYATQGIARNNIGNWQVESVQVKKGTKGFDFYAAKDLQMAKDADYGFMIWNGKSKGTLNNILNLIAQNKRTLMYYTPTNQFFSIDNFEDLEKLVNKCNSGTKDLFKKLSNGSSTQLSLLK